MPLFELDDGRLVPAGDGRSTSPRIDAVTLDVLRSQVLDLVGRPLLPVHRAHTAGSPAQIPAPSPAPAPSPEVTDGSAPSSGADVLALDPNGRPVVVALTAQADGGALLGLLGRSGEAARLSRAEIEDAYPGGAEAFRAAWSQFRAAAPRSASGPPAVLVAFGIDDAVLPAVEAVAGSCVQVIELGLRSVAGGRRLVEAVELRPRVAPGRRPSPAPPVPSPPARTSAAGTGGPVRTSAAGTSGPVRRTGGDPPARTAADLRTVGAALSDPVDLTPRDGEVRGGLARLTPDGVIELADGRTATDPAQAARLAGVPAEGDGWSAWRVGDGGPTLAEALEELHAAQGRSRGRVSDDRPRRRHVPTG